MTHIHLEEAAKNLPSFWKSRNIGNAGNCNIKILKMNSRQYLDEIHDYDEALIVISGKLLLVIDNEEIQVSQGEMYLVSAGVPHSVAAGSNGTLVIIDPAGN